MITILNFKILDSHKIQLEFSDGSQKVIAFSPFIKADNLSAPLAEPDYFKKAELYENGRGIFWPNEYDFCPDFLHQYEPEKAVELAGK